MRGIREVEVPRKSCRSRIQSTAAHSILQALQALASSKVLSRRTGFAVIASLVLVTLWPVCNAKAEVQLQMLYEFFSTNGAPTARLLQESDGSFYGSSVGGGLYSMGALFKFSPDGKHTTVFSFAGTNGSSPWGLTQGLDGHLYGVTSSGGSNFSSSSFSGYGTIFRFTTNGVFTLLTACDITNAGPRGPLACAANGDFYGTTYESGANGLGAIFRVTSNGLLTTIHSFNGTNGAFPNPGLVFGDDGLLYGSTQRGGSNFTGSWTGHGTVFRITTNGLLETLVYFNGANGAGPFSGLTRGSNEKLYGTTRGGGGGAGSVFSVTTNGEFAKVLVFDGSEAWGPYSGVTEGSDGALYGLTGNCCGTNIFNTYGTVYRVTTNGLLTTLSYLDGTNARNPFTEMILASDGNLYGTFADVQRNLTLNGNSGAIFRLVRQPAVSVENLPNGSVKLTWDSFPNGRYRVDYRPSVTVSNWSVLATNVSSAGSVTAFTNSSPGAMERYYRVVVVP